MECSQVEIEGTIQVVEDIALGMVVGYPQVMMKVVGTKVVGRSLVLLPQEEADTEVETEADMEVEEIVEAIVAVVEEIVVEAAVEEVVAVATEREASVVVGIKLDQ